MAISNFHIPTQISFGLGAVAALEEQRLRAGLGRALVVCDRDLEASPTLARVLRYAGPHLLFYGSASPASQEEVLDGAELYVIEECQGIIAIGGASAMELAKAIRLKVTHPLTLADYESSLGGAGRITADLPPLVAVPTLSGACSAVDPFLVISLERTGRRVVISSPYLVPLSVIQDPELSLASPADGVRRAALTVLAQNMDSYLSLGFHPIADAAALEGTRLILGALPVFNDHPRNLEAIAGLIWGSILAAMASEKGPGVTRAIGHLLCHRFSIPYGVARLLLVAAGMHTQDEATRARLQLMERQAGAGPLAEAARRLTAGSGFAIQLRDYHVPEAELEQIAIAATAEPVNGYQFEPGQVVALLRAAW